MAGQYSHRIGNRTGVSAFNRHLTVVKPSGRPAFDPTTNPNWRDLKKNDRVCSLLDESLQGILTRVKGDHGYIDNGYKPYSLRSLKKIPEVK